MLKVSSGGKHMDYRYTTYTTDQHRSQLIQEAQQARLAKIAAEAAPQNRGIVIFLKNIGKRMRVQAVAPAPALGEPVSDPC
jgi:hypothetical protein